MILSKSERDFNLRIEKELTIIGLNDIFCKNIWGSFHVHPRIAQAETIYPVL